MKLSHTWQTSLELLAEVPYIGKPLSNLLKRKGGLKEKAGPIVLILIVIVIVAAYLMLKQKEQKIPANQTTAVKTTNSPVTQLSQSSNVIVNNNSGNTSISIGGNNSGIVQSGSNNKLTYIAGDTNTPPKTTGNLEPRWANDSDAPTNVTRLFTGSYGFNKGYLKINVIPGQTVMPFGENIPLAITRTATGIVVSTEIESLDGKIIAELIEDEWRVNPNAYFKLNYDKSALEVIDDYNIPQIQIEYVTPTILHIGGVFRSRQESWLDNHPQLTNVYFQHFLAIDGGDVNAIIISAEGNMVVKINPKLETEKQKQSYVEDARDIIQPWFDYTPSKGLGVRLPAEPRVITDLSSINIPLSSISGTLEGQPFNCSKAVLEIFRRTLILSQGTDATERVEISLNFRTQIAQAGISIPVNQLIPVQRVTFHWKSGGSGKSKTAELSDNSVVEVQFDNVISNQMSGKLYLESSQSQRTKLAGTFAAQIGQN